MIPVSVIIITKNEAAIMARCLRALRGFFDDVIVIDSHSTDHTAAIARDHGARVVDFSWNGQYPKKKQWSVDHAGARYDWVLLIDADEVMTPALCHAIAALFENGDPPCDGYFIRGRYMQGETPLRYGLHNSKLCLYRRGAFMFPAINDLNLPMGEVEGHYQPQAADPSAVRVGVIPEVLLHYAQSDRAAWLARHERYALWEAGMNTRQAWPIDPVPRRQAIKRLFRALPARGVIAFLHAYILKQGFRSGRAGWHQACDRYLYYRMVVRADRQLRRQTLQTDK